MEHLENYLTTQQAAEALDVHSSRIRHMIRDRVLPNAIKVGPMWLIPVADVEHRKRTVHRRGGETSHRDQGDAQEGQPSP